MKISECVRVQHWCHFSRQNKTKISVSLRLCLLLLPPLLLLCIRCRLAHSSFVNCQDPTALQWLPLMFYIFSRTDICIRSASNYSYVLDTIVCYMPTFQNLVSLNPDKHKDKLGSSALVRQSV